MNSTFDEYPIFLDVLSNFQCYSFNPDIHTATVPIDDIRLAIQPVCSEDRKDRYYMVDEMPIFSRKCEIMKFLHSNQDTFTYYAVVIISTMSIIVAVLLFISLYMEVDYVNFVNV